MASTDLTHSNDSLFDDAYPSSIANRVHQILKEPIDWNIAHRRVDYLDMVKVMYMTFHIECPKFEVVAKLPVMFTKEFAFEMYRYNRVVVRYGNDFEVIIEKRNGALCFTHGWSDVLRCYVDAEDRGAWASLTYIRPKLFVLVLNDRYYWDLLVKHLYPSLLLNLSRTLFGSDKNPSWFDDVLLPYCHEPRNFAHNFIVILTFDDVRSGSLVINYGIFASKHFAKDTKCMVLFDESGLEWICTVKFSDHPFAHLKIGGDWKYMVRMRGYQGGDHVMFGSPINKNTTYLFVRRV